MRLIVVEVGKEKARTERAVALRDGEMRVGRTPDNDIVLGNEVVSRHHAVVSLHDGRCAIRDLKSHNGTWVNGERVGRREVAVGDQIQIGNFVMWLSTDDGIVAAADSGRRAAIEEAPSTERMTAFRGDAGAGGAGNPMVQFVDEEKADGESEMRRSAHAVEGRIVKAYRNLDWVSVEDLMAPESSPVVDEDRQELLGMYLLSRVSERLNVTTSLDEFLGEVLDLVMAIAQADTGVVLLAEGDAVELVPRVIRHFAPLPKEGVPISRSVLKDAVLGGVAIFSADARRDRRFMAAESVISLDIRGAVCVPLMKGGHAVGVLYLTRSSGEFEAGILDLLGPVAHLTASGVERARLKEAMLRERSWRATLERFVSQEVVERIVRPAKGERVEFLVENDAAAMFLDWEGLQREVARLPVSEALPMMNRLSQFCAESVFKELGAIVASSGRGVLAVFGVPDARVDARAAAERAADAVLGMIGELVSKRWSVAERRGVRFASVGIAAGRIRGGVVGDAERLEFFAVGDALARAEETARSAVTGEIGIAP